MWNPFCPFCPFCPYDSSDFAVLLEHCTIFLFKAQAHECIFEKSLLDNRKSVIIAKVAAQVVDYYNVLLRALDNEATLRMPGMEGFKVRPLLESPFKLRIWSSLKRAVLVWFALLDIEVGYSIHSAIDWLIEWLLLLSIVWFFVWLIDWLILRSIDWLIDWLVWFSLVVCTGFHPASVAGTQSGLLPGHGVLPYGMAVGRGQEMGRGDWILESGPSRVGYMQENRQSWYLERGGVALGACLCRSGCIYSSALLIQQLYSPCRWTRIKNMIFVWICSTRETTSAQWRRRLSETLCAKSTD